MKSSDVVLIVVALILFLVLVGGFGFLGDVLNFRFLIKVLLALFLLFYVLGWKLCQYASKMTPNYQEKMELYKKVDDFIQGRLGFLPMIQLGDKLKLDSSYVVVISLVLILIIIL